MAHCFRCGYVETRQGDNVQRRPGPHQQRAAGPIRHETLSEFGRDLWHACRPIAGDALAYLHARCCVVPPANGHLRWHPALRHPPSGTVGPALVALVTDVLTGQALTLHRTWVCASGAKAPVDPPRMLLGGHRKAGGAIRLWPNEEIALALAVAEGLESALSIAHANVPAWSCLDAAGLAAFRVLAGVETLIVAVDNDPAGIDAARVCADRWARAGVDVRVILPAGARTDLNDVAGLP